VNPFVCYIPSFNDSDLVRDSVASSQDWDVIISDNGSAEPHRSALAELAGERVRVIHHPKTVHRVEHWKWCVNHFIQSGLQWMKFLSAGDRHLPDSIGVFQRGIQKFPSVKYIVPRMINTLPQRQILWSPAPDYALVSPADAMRAVALSGNVFHSLSATLIHVDAVADGFQFGEECLNFCADLLFQMNIARKTDTLFVPEPAAEFMIARRKGALAGASTLEHYLEEGLMRLRAAESFEKLTGDRQQVFALKNNLTQWLRSAFGQQIELLTRDFPLKPEQLCPPQA
jgi:hypothetical protein